MMLNFHRSILTSLCCSVAISVGSRDWWHQMHLHIALLCTILHPLQNFTTLSAAKFHHYKQLELGIRMKLTADNVNNRFWKKH